MTQITVPAGVSVYEINSPTRANGARLTMTRQSWPAGNLFSFRIYERERNGELVYLTGATNVQGGNTTGKGGVVNPPMMIQLSWTPDKDKDRIRLEIDAAQSFTTNATLEWLA